MIRDMANSAGIDQEVVRFIWMQVARQARPIGAPAQVYVSLAAEHHCVSVEVIDLGQYSTKHANSCMFLTCAAAIVDRQARGVGTLPPGELGEMLVSAAPGTNAGSPIDDMIEQHRRTRAGTLGRVADVMREAACDM